MIVMVLYVAKVGADISGPLDGMGAGCRGVVPNMPVACLKKVLDGAYGPL